jgi:Kdo2-lipid IVA lauroyltransferase/acyltransferase
MALPRSKTPRILHAPLYLGLRSLSALVGSLPPDQSLPMASSLGRMFAASRLNRRRLARAEANLAAAFPEWTPAAHREYAIRSWEHLALLGAEIIYFPRFLSEDGWGEHVAMGMVEPVMRELLGSRPCFLITGHCGNWEALGYTLGLLGFPAHALYRPLDLPPLDSWVRKARQRRGLMLVDKFGALRQLPELVQQGAPLAFVADQNGGDRGMFVPFFNRLTSTYKSIGLLAMQFNATIACGVARRVGPDEGRQSGGEEWRGFPGMRFQMEVVDMFGPEDWSTHPDPLFYLTARYRRAIELMVRRAPEQYLWMHRIWRSRPRHERQNKPMPNALLEKLRALPWLTEADIEAIQENSRRDARTLAETGLDRLP